MQIRLKAKLGMGGRNLDSRLIEDRLGVQATHSFRTGEVTRLGNVLDAGGCIWETRYEATRASDLLVQRLLEPFRPLTHFRRVADEFNATVFVEIVAHVRGDMLAAGEGIGFLSPTYELSRQSIADLAVIRAEYGVDQYIGIDRRPDDDRPDEERSDDWI